MVEADLWGRQKMPPTITSYMGLMVAAKVTVQWTMERKPVRISKRIVGASAGLEKSVEIMRQVLSSMARIDVFHYA